MFDKQFQQTPHLVIREVKASLQRALNDAMAEVGPSGESGESGHPI